MTRAAIDEAVREIEAPASLVEIVINMLLILKLQQLNIELLWKANASETLPIEGASQLIESSRRLADSMEQIAAILAASNTPTH
jgi:hypothetical protein